MNLACTALLMAEGFSRYLLERQQGGWLVPATEGQLMPCEVGETLHLRLQSWAGLGPRRPSGPWLVGGFSAFCNPGL